MAQAKATEVEQPQNETADLIPEERLKEILNILLPYGYSYCNGQYTGVSPFIGSTRNIITILVGWGSVFSICMERFDENSNEADSLGFYKGIMKVIAPELHSDDETFIGSDNVLDFNWAEDEVQENRFPVKVEYSPKLQIEQKEL